ncbi:MAG: flagellar hook assembly protein FlgD [Hyphomicrobium sp.]
MTTVAGISSAQGLSDGTTQSTAIKKETLDYDAFLKLLVAQMQNQDPLKPMDSTEYMAQLSSFSNVEQGLKMNAKLDQMLVLSNLTQASSAIGKSITSADGSISGVVASVKVVDGGATAILTDGRQVSIGSGVTIGA